MQRIGASLRMTGEEDAGATRPTPYFPLATRMGRTTPVPVSMGRTTFLGPFTLSCALHALALVVVAWLFITRDPVLTTSILTVLPPVAAPHPAGDHAGPSVSFDLPAPPKTVAPTRASASSPTPSAPAAPIRPPKPAPAPSQPSGKSPSGRKMTYAEFKDLQSGSKPARQPAPSVPSVPSVSTSFDFPSTQPHSSPLDPSPGSFAEALLRDLQEALVTAGFPAGLAAKVEFSFGADGVIKHARILTSSSDRRFDDAVLQAFRAVRVRGFSAGEVGHRFDIRFRVAVAQ